MRLDKILQLKHELIELRQNPAYAEIKTLIRRTVRCIEEYEKSRKDNNHRSYGNLT